MTAAVVANPPPSFDVEFDSPGEAHSVPQASCLALVLPAKQVALRLSVSAFDKAGWLHWKTQTAVASDVSRHGHLHSPFQAANSITSRCLV